MAQDGFRSFGADIGGALSSLGQLRQAVAAVSDPAARLRTAFTEANVALQGLGDTAAAQRRADIAALATFKANMQIMVDARRLSVQQALGFETAYSGQLQSQGRARIEAALASDSSTVASRLDAPSPAGLFDQGTIAGVSGANAGHSRTISRMDDGTAYLLKAWLYPVTAGDNVPVVAGMRPYRRYLQS